MACLCSQTGVYVVCFWSAAHNSVDPSRNMCPYYRSGLCGKAARLVAYSLDKEFRKTVFFRYLSRCFNSIDMSFAVIIADGPRWLKWESMPVYLNTNVRTVGFPCILVIKSTSVIINVTVVRTIFCFFLQACTLACVRYLNLDFIQKCSCVNTKNTSSFT